MKFTSLALLVFSSGLLLTYTTALVIPIPRDFRLQDSSQGNEYEIFVEDEDLDEYYQAPCYMPTVSASDPATPIGTSTMSISTTEVELDRVVLEERPVGDDGMIEVIEEIIVEEVVETVVEITYEIEVPVEEPVEELVEEPAVQQQSQEEEGISENEYDIVEITYIEENVHNSQFQDEDEDAEASTSKIICTFNAENDVICTYEGSQILPPNEDFALWEEDIKPEGNN